MAKPKKAIISCAVTGHGFSEYECGLRSEDWAVLLSSTSAKPLQTAAPEKSSSGYASASGSHST